MRSLKKFLKSKRYLYLPLVLTKMNHFEVVVKINGIPGRFIVDTGASNTCVGVDKTGLFKMVSQTSEVKAAGAGATEMETLVSTGNTIAIGEWEKSNQSLVLFDLVHVNQALLDQGFLPVDGIIGADLLTRGRAVIDYDAKCLYLKKDSQK